MILNFKIRDGGRVNVRTLNGENAAVRFRYISVAAIIRSPSAAIHSLVFVGAQRPPCFRYSVGPENQRPGSADDG
jgi:hypothetical protein